MFCFISYCFVFFYILLWGTCYEIPYYTIRLSDLVLYLMQSHFSCSVVCDTVQWGAMKCYSITCLPLTSHHTTSPTRGYITPHHVYDTVLHYLIVYNYFLLAISFMGNAIAFVTLLCVWNLGLESVIALMTDAKSSEQKEMIFNQAISSPYFFFDAGQV